MWNAVAGSTPVCSRLADRHCGNDRQCPRCGIADETINHMLFECPLAKQVWLLSNIHSTPGSLPCNILLSNFDFLLWRLKETGVPENIAFGVPWICWFIWKARNEKVFKGKDVAPHESLQMAFAEADSWLVAQVVTRSLDTVPPTDNISTHNSNVMYPRCQVDASWVHNNPTFGGGLVLDIDEDTGSFASTQVLTPLHAEFHSLIWAMKAIRQLGYVSVSFETDCLQLVKLVEEKEEDWPSLASELEDFRFTRLTFLSFSLTFIPRIVNVRADSLAKEARTRGSCFSHVNSCFSSETVPRAAPFVTI
ncbi:unnamed protein product [Microthlaspi erraticum]|uniref:RNase H type-1 domain-containing protein n=1 Tax=Microthlaspi erraticum TaxID=1685480 RepID=A0A6D2KNM2_9BRAS|nr:unnamed protein product [Microthlaspi erraticum]